MRELPARSKSAAGAIGAKSARACDRCLVRRARWYCAADDAFLCQLCDSSVHLANSVARRHERVRVKTSTSSSKWSKEEGRGGGEEPAWHQGFRRKARTPRGGGGVKVAKREVADVGGSDTLVPDLDLSYLEDFAAVEEEQLLYRVPILEPVLLSDLCSSPTPSGDVAKPHLPPQTAHDNNKAVVLPPVVKSDVEISDFEMAEVESFLRRGLGGGDNACSMEELGLMVEEDYGVKSTIPVVKKEEEVDVDLHREEAPMVKLDWGSPKEEIKPLVDGEKMKKRKRRRTTPIMLDLNYEGVMSSWNKQEASPWVDGSRPQLDLDNWSPDFTCGGGGDVQGARAQGGREGESGYGARAGGGGGGGDDGGREARVLRYKEKRRTRLFSKKIRYEVRKLNAEKRPRMKGRFVKRASLLSNTTAAATAAAATISGDHGVVPRPQYAF